VVGTSGRGPRLGRGAAAAVRRLVVASSYIVVRSSTSSPGAPSGRTIGMSSLKTGTDA
jgi:hypothetical protein